MLKQDVVNAHAPKVQYHIYIINALYSFFFLTITLARSDLSIALLATLYSMYADMHVMER